MPKTLNQGVPGVPSQETRTNARKDGNTLMCSIRCSIGVPSKPVIHHDGPMEHLEIRSPLKVFQKSVPNQTRINAGSQRDWNTWNTGNTIPRGAQVKRR